MSFTLPTKWSELTQPQLRYAVRMLWLYGETPDWEERVMLAAFLHYAGVEVVKRTVQGWLCRMSDTSQAFVLDPQLLPSVVQPLAFLCQTDTMDVRIEKVGEHTGYDFELQEMPFGNFLQLEGLYQSYLQSQNEECLLQMCRILYKVEDESDMEDFQNEIPLGAFLWFCSVKRLLAEEFPNFFKPASESGGQITRELLVTSMRAQMRLLTKGDVTKEQHIREKVDTWTALAELDASAKESDELNRKYGKK